MPAWQRNFVPGSIFALFAIFLSLYFADAYYARSEFFRYAMLDVGEGDASWMETPGHFQVLVDGGPDGGVLKKLERIMPFWDRTIDLVVLSHAHADHLGGLIEVLKRYEVEAILESGAEAETAEYGAWKEARDREGARLIFAESGASISIGGDFRILVLAPFKSMRGSLPENAHDASTIIRAEYGSTSFLFMGDAERSFERELVSRNIALRSDILKVGHHGSVTSSSNEFLNAVEPEFALISVGAKNRYGHPNGGVLEKLRKIAPSVLRTDEEGDIFFESDGKGLWRAPD